MSVMELEICAPIDSSFSKPTFTKCPHTVKTQTKSPRRVPGVRVYLGGSPLLFFYVQVETQPITKPLGKKQWLIKMNFKGGELN